MPDAASPIPLLRASLKELRVYLKDRREVLATALAEQNHVSSKEALERLDGMVAALQLIDRIEIRHRATAGQVTLSLVIHTSQPLKKN